MKIARHALYITLLIAGGSSLAPLTAEAEVVIPGHTAGPEKSLALDVTVTAAPPTLAASWTAETNVTTPIPNNKGIGTIRITPNRVMPGCKLYARAPIMPYPNTLPIYKNGGHVDEDVIYTIVKEGATDVTRKFGATNYVPDNVIPSDDCAATMQIMSDRDQEVGAGTFSATVFFVAALP
ncbi:hypothetical protein S726_005396 [Salmonella enterica subsp. enterica]|nr:hypothetical protein [Salmonella enterica subsp. enterica]